MTERRPATTIGELDIHLGFVMDEIRDFKALLGQMSTRAETERNIAEAVRVVAEDLATLKRKVDDQSPRSMFDNLTRISLGIAAIAAALAVFVGVVHWSKL